MTDGLLGEQIEQRLRELYARHLPLGIDGVASYYEPGRGYSPAALAGEERDRFGIAMMAVPDAQLHAVGDHDVRFALQSISKVFVYALALADNGRRHVLDHVGVEPTGDPFNAIVFEAAGGRPFNPMVNAGAILTTSLVRGGDADEKLERILEVLRRFAGNPRLEVDADVFRREMLTADRNRAIAYLLRSEGRLVGDAEAILGLYLRQCSVLVTCRDLAAMAATLANGLVNPLTGDRVLPRECVRDVLSVMYTCGMYDFAGEWAFEVGVPAKSSVAGGIIAVIPGKMGIGTFSPGLDVHGNSVRGVRVCRDVSERLGLHVFATEGEDALLAAPPGAERA